MKVLFVGKGASPICYYRCLLPARAIGADWVGVAGSPPKPDVVTGSLRNPDYESYDVVVVQQPSGKEWLRMIQSLRERGVRVVYEVDDYLHGIKHQLDHQHRKKFDNSYLSQAEAAMKACDAIICSTEWIASNYSSFNKNVYICRNGIDPKRYDLEKPERNTVNIGWAGSTGHRDTIIPWLQAVAAVMDQRPYVCFVSIGERLATAFEQKYGAERALTLPWMQIEQYPAAMTSFDMTIAPSGKGGWWKAKSDLRWLESSVSGIPCVANPANYPEVEHGATGLHATTRMEAYEQLLLLTGDADLRTNIGSAAKDHVLKHRTISAMSGQWHTALDEILRL